MQLNNIINWQPLFNKHEWNWRASNKFKKSYLLLLLGDYHRYLCEISNGNMKLMC
jgi:hypothetical protein